VALGGYAGQLHNFILEHQLRPPVEESNDIWADC